MTIVCDACPPVDESSREGPKRGIQEDEKVKVGGEQETMEALRGEETYRYLGRE